MRLSALFLCLLLNNPRLEAINISSTSNQHSLYISAENLIGGAGTDLMGSIPLINLTLSIENTTSEKTWSVYAKTSSTYKLPSGQLLIQRTGKNNSQIHGGLNPLSINPSKKIFFTGKGNANAISVQTQISGMTLSHAIPDLYDTSIIFEVEEN